MPVLQCGDMAATPATRKVWCNRLRGPLRRRGKRSIVIPPATIVTSRFRAGHRHRYHFALVCSSPEELMFKPAGPRFAMRDLVNVVSGLPVGFSQVTAIVRHDPCGGHSSSAAGNYHAAMMVDLVVPYFLRLRFPEPLKTSINEPFVLTA